MVGNLMTESPALRAEAARVVKRDPDAVFDVVVPVSDLPPAVALFSTVDAYRLRYERAARIRQRLVSVGAKNVRVHLAQQDPVVEIDAVLAKPGFAAAIVSTPPRGSARRRKSDLPGHISRHHPELRVRVVTAPSDFYDDPLLDRFE